MRARVHVRINEKMTNASITKDLYLYMGCVRGGGGRDECAI